MNAARMQGCNYKSMIARFRNGLRAWTENSPALRAAYGSPAEAIGLGAQMIFAMLPVSMGLEAVDNIRKKDAAPPVAMYRLSA